MDGAMKFVKGDVIASLVITVINILGGLAIGVAQKEMTAVLALKRYGLLTIGDGLVSQIPALILSTAAGVLVTRTASEEPDTPLGEELSRQLLGTPKALQVAAVFVLLLAIVPGLPTAPFLLIGIALFWIARGPRSCRWWSLGVSNSPTTSDTCWRTAPRSPGKSGLAFALACSGYVSASSPSSGSRCRRRASASLAVCRRATSYWRYTKSPRR
jgi:hypothetical protein